MFSTLFEFTKGFRKIAKVRFDFNFMKMKCLRM